MDNELKPRLFTEEIIKKILPKEWHQELYATEMYRIYPQAKGTAKSTFVYVYFLWLFCNYGVDGWNGIIARYIFNELKKSSIKGIKKWITILKNKYGVDILKTYKIKDYTKDTSDPRYEMENGASIFFRAFNYDKGAGAEASYGDICAFFLDEGVPKKLPQDVDMDELASDFIALLNTYLRGSQFKQDVRHLKYDYIPKCKFIILPYNVWRPNFWMHTLFVTPYMPLTDELKAKIKNNTAVRYINPEAFDNLGLRIMRAKASQEINPYLTMDDIRGIEALNNEDQISMYETIKYGFEYDGSDPDIYVYKKDFEDNIKQWDYSNIDRWHGLMGGIDIGGTAKSRRSRTVLCLTGFNGIDEIYNKFKGLYIIKGFVYDVKKTKKILTEKQKIHLMITWINKLLENPLVKSYIYTFGLIIHCDPKKTLFIEDLNELSTYQWGYFPKTSRKIINFRPAIVTGRWDIDNRIDKLKQIMSNGRLYFNRIDFPELYDELQMMEYNDDGNIAKLLIDGGKRVVDCDTHDGLCYSICQTNHLIKGTTTSLL